LFISFNIWIFWSSTNSYNDFLFSYFFRLTYFCLLTRKKEKILVQKNNEETNFQSMWWQKLSIRIFITILLEWRSVRYLKLSEWIYNWIDPMILDQLCWLVTNHNQLNGRNLSVKVPYILLAIIVELMNLKVYILMIVLFWLNIIFSLSLFLISKCFYYKPVNDCCSHDDSEVAEKHRRFFILCGDTNDIRVAFVNVVLLIVDISEQDSILLILLLIILIFTQRLSMNEDEPSLNNSLAVNQAQVHYTTLLWKYLINKRGKTQACKQFIQLLNIIFRI
jgi:hypothetical protein